MFHKLPLASILIFLGCGLFALLPDSWIDCLQYDRVAILDGEVWRLWSAHAVHFTFRHALVDTGVLFLAGVIVECEIGAQRMVSTLAVTAPLISLGLLLGVPDLLHYRGASGVATMMLVFAIGLLLAKRPSRTWLLLAAGSAIIGKIGSEALGSPANISNLPANLAVVWQAHLFGAIFGALIAWNFCRKR